MLDLIAHRLVYIVDVGGTPHFIITGLYPPAILDIPTPVSNTISSQQSTFPQLFWVVVFIVSFITVVIVMLIFVWQLRRSLKSEHKL